MKPSVLIIDDEETFRQLLSRIISLEGYTIFQAATIKEGLRILEQENDIDVVLTDVKLPDGNGIDMLARVKQLSPLSELIVMTAYGTIHDGVKAMKAGAFDYFTKGDDNDQIIPTIHRAAEKAGLQKKVQALEKKLEAKHGFDTIIGQSQAIKATIRMAEKVALTDSTVLLEGETGVGKELFAQALHYAGPRKSKPFVAVNCSALPKDLLESELFGYKKGAFTGALTDKKGLFEEAMDGTLFLDEMGEMGLDLQAKLLRVLETRSFIKLGDSKPTKADVRIIAATNRNLKQESDEERFRADLYYRLSTFSIIIPPLRERSEDIEALAHHFMSASAIRIKKRISGMDKGFIKALKHYTWKGNIRELKNIIERAVILCDTSILTCDLLPPEIMNSSPESLPGTSLSCVEKAHIKKTLLHTKGNKTKAADLLGIGLTTLYRKIEEYNI